MVESASHRWLLEDAALVDVGAWEVLTATGADRLSFLHRLLTARIEGVMPGNGRRALLLTVKGHVVVELRICVRTDDVVILVPQGQGESTTAALSRYAIMDDVTLVRKEGERVLAVYGPRAAARLGEVGLAVPPAIATGPALAHAEIGLSGAPGLIVRTPGFGSAGFWIVADAAAVAETERALRAQGVGTLSPEIAEGLRILAGEPKFGSEITSDAFPMEVGLDSLIDYGKGCYLGQEPIVRIRDRGHVNWRLCGLRLLEEGSLSPGDRLETDARPKAGRVTSASRLPGQPPVALALVHVSVPVGASVRVRHEERSIEAEIVPAAGAASVEA